MTKTLSMATMTTVHLPLAKAKLTAKHRRMPVSLKYRVLLPFISIDELHSIIDCSEWKSRLHSHLPFVQLFDCDRMQERPREMMFGNFNMFWLICANSNLNQINRMRIEIDSFIFECTFFLYQKSAFCHCHRIETISKWQIVMRYRTVDALARFMDSEKLVEINVENRH